MAKDGLGRILRIPTVVGGRRQSTSVLSTATTTRGAGGISAAGSGLTNKVSVSPGNGTAPVITSAVLAGDVLTLQGANFLDKDLTRSRMLPLVTGTTGQGVVAAGFDYLEAGQGAGTSVYMEDGVGGGSIRSVGGDETFHEYAMYSESGHSEAFGATWIKMYGVAPFRDRQVKLMRIGPRNDGSDSKLYYKMPKFGFSAHPAPTSMVGGLQANFWTSAGEEKASYHYVGDGSPYDADYSQWLCIETYQKFNDIGLSNGIQQIETAGRMVCNKSDRYGRTALNQYLDYFMPFPGHANSEGSGLLTVLISRPYFDVGPTCRARVWLGDAATPGACTKKFIVPSSAWANDGTEGPAVNVPNWALYAYLTTRNGVTSLSGKALS